MAKVVDLINNPPAPTDKLVQAAKRFKERSEKLRGFEEPTESQKADFALVEKVYGK